MGRGLYFNPNDGGPVMEIQAGIRCPSYSGGFFIGDGPSKHIDNYNANSQMLFIPRSCASYSNPSGTEIIGTITMLDSVSYSGGICQQKLWNSKGTKDTIGLVGSIWQIFPPGNSGIGLLIQDSTDFTQIPATAPIGFCVWRGVVSFTGDMNIPATGYPNEKLMVFASWSADNVTVEYFNGVVSAYVDRNGSDVAATITNMTLAIFAAGVDPTPATGLTFIVNGRCTFSLAKRPFIFQGATWTPSNDSVDIGNNLILLNNYGYDSDTSGGWDWMKYLGIVRSGNVVRLGRGKVRWQWTDKYSIVGRRVANLPVPLIPAMY